MVWHQGNAHRLVPRLHLFIDGTHHSAVEVLDGLELELEVAIVACLVARLHMQEHEVVVTKSFEGCCCLAFIVGVGQSGSTFNDDVLQSGIVAYSSDEIHGRNDVAALYLWEHLRQGLHGRAVATAPRPDAVGGVLALCLALAVERVLSQQLLRLQDEVVDQVCCLLCRHAVTVFLVGPALFGFYEQRSPLLVGMVVRRSTLNVLVAVLYDEQVAILNACDELDVFIAQLLVKIFDECVAVFCFQVSAVVVLYASVGKSYDVATHGKVVRLHLVAYRCSLKRSAAFIDLVEVVAKYCGVGNLAARVKALGHRHHAAAASLACKKIHVWGVGILKKCFAAQSCDSVVCHAVA